MLPAKTLINKYSDYFLDLIYPKECVGCGKEGFWICPKCEKEIIRIKSFYCPSCKSITKNGQFCNKCRGKYKLTGIIIAGHYKYGPLREAIHSYKYDHILELEKYFRTLLVKRLRGKLPHGEKIIIPIPLYPRKRRERGFNQAERLSKIISQKFNIPLENKILERIKETEPQMLLKKKERIINIKDAFKIINTEKVKDKTVLLVDDVTTTGLTLDEAAKVLRQAGAKQIWGVVIAQG